MSHQRPELGATLDHLCIHSAEPERLAQFYESAYAVDRTPLAGGWLCAAVERRLFISAGEPNTVGAFAYGFATREALIAHRAALQAKGLALRANPSPLFDDDAFAVADPDGNVVAFGVSFPRKACPGLDPGREPGDSSQRHWVPAGAGTTSLARLQHCAFRTANIDAMVAFYTSLGFVVSDRVEDDAGALRACFLRTDHEHHALALFGAAAARLDHISCETSDLVGVVGWADRMSAQHIPIHWGVGRHGPGNDIFFMVRDPDDNLIEISAELEVCAPERPAGRWRHEPRTLNLWGTAIMRS